MMHQVQLRCKLVVLHTQGDRSCILIKHYGYQQLQMPTATSHGIM